jgi:parallel beta-helix repeat protein/predicted outer membrane repeat protein
MSRFIVLVVWLMVCLPLHAATITIDDDGPADFNTIQEALDAATTGDTLIVADGLYVGPDNRALDFNGKDLTLRSENGPATCIIDCQRQDRAFYVNEQEGPSCLIEGFTIINGSASPGGAIYCYRSSPTISHCILEDNEASYYGGAIACGYDSYPTITSCIIRNNTAYYGGGIQCDEGVTIVGCKFVGNYAHYAGGAVVGEYGTSGTMINCVFAGNTADGDGGAISTGYSGSWILTNCTFGYNSAANDGGGIYCEYSSSIKATNCLFAGNLNHAIYKTYSSAEQELSYCLFAGNTGGDFYDADERQSYMGAAQLNVLPGFNDNVSGDPAFAFTNDFHLMVGSSAIDNGTPETSVTLPSVDIEGRTRVVDGSRAGAARIDIGAYEYDPEAPAIALSTECLEFVREQGGSEPENQVLSIRNSATGWLGWRVEEQCPWLTVSPMEGTSAGHVNEVTFSLDTSQLSRGLYQCSVKIVDSSASNNPREVLVRLRVKGELRVPEEFTTIAGAVKAAMDGETIVVSEGTYPEYITVDKPLTLQGLGMPTIERAGTTVLRLTADDCTVEGFVFAAGSTGISVESSHNTISGNSIVGNQRGVYLGYNADRNTLVGNEIKDNTSEGVDIYFSAYNTLRENHISGSAVGFAITGAVDDYSQDINLSNTVDGKPIYYLVEQSGVVVDAASNAACVFAVDCSEIVVKDLTLSGNGRGVCFIATDHSTIENVVAQDNAEAGIWLRNSTDNTLTGNTVSNSRYGIMLYQSGNNTLAANACSGNDYNFWCRGSTVQHYLQNIDLSNTVQGKPIYYLVGTDNVIIDAATDAGCVYAVNCQNITVGNLDLKDNGIGVALIGSSESQIANVVCVHNAEAGILLRDCTGMAIEGLDSLGNGAGLAAYGGNDIQIDGVCVATNTAGVKFVGNQKATIVNSVIRSNSEWAGTMEATAETWGGILAEDGTDLSIINCTIYGNAGSYYSGYDGGGIVCDDYSAALVVNSIIWANCPEQIDTGYSWIRGGGGTGSVIVAHSDVQGGFEGLENIDAAPLITCDGHLQLDSPCIDRGDANIEALPSVDVDGEVRLSGPAVDLGADEYADRDLDGLPNWWETTFFGDDSAAPGEDPDEDGHTNLDEYRWYASDPVAPADTYYVDAIQGDTANDGQSPETALASIQAAIEIAQNSDTVLVAPGAYGESLNLLGRQIILCSSDPADRDVVASTMVAGPVSLVTGELPGCVIDGLTITPLEGSITPYYGEMGIICTGSSPTIRRCAITGLGDMYYSPYNTGVAITCYNAEPAILQCTIRGNVIEYQASLIQMDNSDAVLRNCLICGNWSQYNQDEGLVVNLTSSKLKMDNCTIAQNGNPDQSAWFGSAVYCNDSELLIANSILWDNTYREVGSSSSRPSTIEVVYSDVRLRSDLGVTWSWPGQGNICADPCFVRLGYWSDEPYYYYYGATWIDGDYHLKSQAWRWSASLSHGTHWVWDGQTSLCIDTGNPGSPLADELTAVPNDPDNEFGCNVRINMGAYGGTAQASMGPVGWALLGDLTNDGTVDDQDRGLWAENSMEPDDESPADLDRDGDVDSDDSALLDQDWQKTTIWFGTMPLLQSVTSP